jgi:hypothetical protein
VSVEEVTNAMLGPYRRTMFTTVFSSEVVRFLSISEAFTANGDDMCRELFDVEDEDATASHENIDLELILLLEAINWNPNTRPFSLMHDDVRKKAIRFFMLQGAIVFESNLLKVP